MIHTSSAFDTLLPELAASQFVKGCVERCDILEGRNAAESSLGQTRGCRREDYAKRATLEAISLPFIKAMTCVKNTEYLLILLCNIYCLRSR